MDKSGFLYLCKGTLPSTKREEEKDPAPGEIQTQDLLIMRSVLYRCAAAIFKWWSTSAWAYCWEKRKRTEEYLIICGIQTQYLIIMSDVLYCCATTMH